MFREAGLFLVEIDGDNTVTHYIRQPFENEPDFTVTSVNFDLEKLLAIEGPDFNPTTWEAFQRLGVDGVPGGRVAEELSLYENAVILAQSRVLKRLREEAGDLLW